MGSEGHDDWMKFIMGMGKQYKDKYGEWVFDIEQFDDGLADPDDDEHFEEDLFKV